MPARPGLCQKAALRSVRSIPGVLTASEPAKIKGVSIEKTTEPGTLPIPAPEAAVEEAQLEPPRGTIAEWTITVLLLLFLTTTLVQAFVIPTGSMEDTLLIGDHLLVDKLAYAPAGPVSKFVLPYRPVKRGDIIVFRYPVDIRQTFVKRCIGVPGDRIRIINKSVYLNDTSTIRATTSIPIATIFRASLM
ncbi:MAG: signal peptidase I [Acidobacteria bacterium]|nr:MAG: signal peptidase I [Acidobacteriota bacterium]